MTTFKSRITKKCSYFEEIAILYLREFLCCLFEDNKKKLLTTFFLQKLNVQDFFQFLARETWIDAFLTDPMNLPPNTFWSTQMGEIPRDN